MKKDDKGQKIIFFAYQGRRNGQCDENVDAILEAVKQYNQHQSNYIARAWEEYTQTTPISKDILSAIETCEIFVCDLTYLNRNVLFELGYAIAKDKKILALLNQNISGTKEKYSNFILKDIRYEKLINHKDILAALQRKDYKEGLLNLFVTVDNIEKNINDLFYLQSKIPNQQSIDLTEAIEKFRKTTPFSLIRFDPTEVVYQSMASYFQAIIKSKICIMHFIGKEIVDEDMENGKNSFYAGIACGLGKEVLLVAPAVYRAPLDYHDILVQYTSSEELIKNVIDWLKERSSEFGPPKGEGKEEHEINLIKLGIGCDVAEDEKDDLLSYFVETASYNAAVTRPKSIITGRKGSGKSAIYIKLINDLSKDKLHYIIDLKPESDELLENIQLSSLYKSSASFFSSVWKLVILSKLIYSIYERLMGKIAGASFSDAENCVIQFVEKHEAFIKLNFFGIIKEINKRATSSSSIDGPIILERLYKEYLGPLINIIKDYFISTNLRYYKIIILADNLDKAWNIKSELDVQSEMILSLMEIENKLINELMDKKGSKIEIKQILFLRKDILDYILIRAPEPDKLTGMAHEIDWENFPNLLRQLIEDRFRFVLDRSSHDSVDDVWDEYFAIKEPFKEIEEIITKRPRDVIYFIMKLFESAINNGHSKVEISDFEKAIEDYSNFLNNSLITETRAEYPEISQVLSRLQKHFGQIIEYNGFIKIIVSAGIPREKIDKLIETLFKKGYLLGFNKKEGKPFNELHILNEQLKKRWFFVFPNKVYLIAHAKYWYIKNKRAISF